MKFVVAFEIDAEIEYLEAVEWYENEPAGLGSDLINAVDDCLNVLRRNAYFELRYRDLRILNIKGFPYQLIYKISANEITIISFFHGHRDPEIWKGKSK